MGYNIMVTYRRADIPGGTYFFTVVTHKRRKIFASSEARTFLREAIVEVRQHSPFRYSMPRVLLPERSSLYLDITARDYEFFQTVGRIKAGFSKRAKGLLHDEALLTKSRMNKRESTIWQRRFWEHAICDEADLRSHMDYIHYNPVKHGLVEQVCDWPYSTFHRLVVEGTYPRHWGKEMNPSGDTFGE